MKRSYLILLFALTASVKGFSQTTTLTEDVNGNLNTNRVIATTSSGQIFFSGHQYGSSYAYPAAGIFRAITDNANGTVNYFYDGVTNGITTYSIRADGQGYFAGKVGIGTANPSASLSVVGTILSSVANASGDNNNVMITNPNAATLTNDLRGDIWLDNDGRMKFRCVTGYGMAFRNGSNTSDILNITDNGLSVGSSTVPTGYAFAVNGSGIATSFTVKAYANWPDYVFKPTYHLPSLSEVKAYVELNHHLPEIPSEKEIATNGLNLGDIDRLLTKKVEELTLYLIEKDKELGDEKEIISMQQKQLDHANAQLKAQDERLRIIELTLKKASK